MNNAAQNTAVPKTAVLRKIKIVLVAMLMAAIGVGGAVSPAAACCAVFEVDAVTSGTTATSDGDDDGGGKGDKGGKDGDEKGIFHWLEFAGTEDGGVFGGGTTSLD